MKRSTWLYYRTMHILFLFQLMLPELPLIGEQVLAKQCPSSTLPRCSTHLNSNSRDCNNLPIPNMAARIQAHRVDHPPPRSTCSSHSRLWEVEPLVVGIHWAFQLQTRGSIRSPISRGSMSLIRAWKTAPPPLIVGFLKHRRASTATTLQCRFILRILP